MSYKCVNCGHIFCNGEQKEYREPHGEVFWGCPLCQGDFEETYPCKICTSEHWESELHSGVCDECLKERKKDLDTCLNIGKNECEEIEINGFLSYVFEKKEIEDILICFLKNKQINVEDVCSRYADEDIGWFAEQLSGVIE